MQHAKRRRTYVILAVVSSLVLILVIVLAATLSHHHDSQPNSSNTSNNATQQSGGSAASVGNDGNAANGTLIDIQTMVDRRIDTIVGSITNASAIPQWLSTLNPNGMWPASEVNYTSGCPAQRANWPAEDHWTRIIAIAGAWRGSFANQSQLAHNDDVRNSISSAMNYWFSNDFPRPACIDSGNTPACPCSTPGLWNTNWFSSVILIPKLVVQACLLLNGTLSTSEMGGCTKFADRSYATFVVGINGVPAITGANALDIASIGIDGALIANNMTMLADAYQRVHSEVVIQNAVKADGIRADGSFGQHGGILYNGNYGKDYINDVLNVEIAAADSQYQANNDSRDAVETLLEGDQWMIYKNVNTGVLHWDFSVIGRFIAFPVADDQVAGHLKINLTQVQALAQEWNSDELNEVFNNLSGDTNNANSGSISGNRMFYANDYMVHRSDAGYVTTLKMLSSRTQGSECTNSANPFGFHLGDGTLYTHLQGDEYEDIPAAWDWNLIPGITVDYGATQLNCNTAGKGGIQTRAGGASDGEVGVAAMHYENPLTQSLQWKKAWFFLPNDVQHVTIANIQSTTQAPVRSVLDQRRLTGDVIVNGATKGSGKYNGAMSLWHGGVGYTFDPTQPVSLEIDASSKSGSWSAISTSMQPPTTANIFAAWLNHENINAPVSYSIFPATTSDSFNAKAASSSPTTIRNDNNSSAIVSGDVAMIVVWNSQGDSVTIPSSSAGTAPVTVASSAGANIIIRMETFTVTVADPTQLLQSISLTFSLGQGNAPSGWGMTQTSKTLTFQLPSGGMAGSSSTLVLGQD